MNLQANVTKVKKFKTKPAGGAVSVEAVPFFLLEVNDPTNDLEMKNDYWFFLMNEELILTEHQTPV